MGRLIHRPDDVVSRPDALIHKARIVIQISPSRLQSALVRIRATNMEIADSTSTVRTPAFHGPNARIADMEIACWRIAVRTFIPLGPDARSLIWKLLAADVRPSRHQCLTVRTRLLNKNDFQRNFWKILSHSCPSGRLRFTVRTASLHITIVAHSAPQPINRGP
jgi:hypothetical protein